MKLFFVLHFLELVKRSTHRLYRTFQGVACKVIMRVRLTLGVVFAGFALGVFYWMVIEYNCTSPSNVTWNVVWRWGSYALLQIPLKFYW